MYPSARPHRRRRLLLSLNPSMPALMPTSYSGERDKRPRPCGLPIGPTRIPGIQIFNTTNIVIVTASPHSARRQFPCAACANLIDIARILSIDCESTGVEWET